MIKTFENFKKVELSSRSQITPELFQYCYEKVRLLINDSWPCPDEFNYLLDDRFIGEDSLVIDFRDINFPITTEIMADVIEVYERLQMKWKISELPDYDAIKYIFSDLDEMTEVTFCLLLQQHQIKYTISLIPSVKYFPDSSKIQFDLDEFDKITFQLKPIISRIKDLGYKVNTYLVPFGKVDILISN